MPHAPPRAPQQGEVVAPLVETSSSFSLATLFPLSFGALVHNASASGQTYTHASASTLTAAPASGSGFIGAGAAGIGAAGQS
eukprot:SAG11_NODE_217_length_12229_cov_9.152185_12_plen_82_part_00